MYMEVCLICACAQSVEVNGLNYKMEGLNKFTEYTVRVSAINRYGPGPAPETASVTTQSDGEPRVSVPPSRRRTYFSQ